MTQDTSRANSPSTTLNIQTVEKFDWGFKGVMEVYGVSQCSHLPPASSIAFSGAIYEQGRFGSYWYYEDESGSLSWSTWVASGLSPACGYTATNTSASVATLAY